MREPRRHTDSLGSDRPRSQSVVRLWPTDADLPLDAAFESHSRRAALGRFADLAALIDATCESEDTLRVRWLHSHGIPGLPITPSRVRKVQLLVDGLLAAEVAYGDARAAVP